MTPKKCMSIAKSLTDTQHMELEPLCSGITVESERHVKSVKNTLHIFAVYFIIRSGISSSNTQY